MPLDQSRAPILEALREVQSRKPSTYGAPGHHAGKGAQRDVTKLIGGKVFKADVLTLKGVDDRRETKQVRQNAEQLAAEAWGAESCYFSSNGSTLSGQAAILACAGPGDKVLVARNAHKSTIAAVIYAGLELVLTRARSGSGEWDIEHGISAAEVARKLDAHPDAKRGVYRQPHLLWRDQRHRSHCRCLPRARHAADRRTKRGERCFPSRPNCLSRRYGSAPIFPSPASTRRWER
jgi:arginine/lysine/ornithine decarboxylase